MARSSDINQRIVLTGADEVRRHLEAIGAAGEKSGNQVRATLQAATGNLGSFTASAKSAATSSGQMRFALQNLSFQVNDIATSLASGGDVMRVFAQQGGQIFQAFQQGGGAKAVFGAAATAIGGMVSPMTAAIAAAAGLTIALGALIARSVDTTTAAKQFDAQLTGLGKNSRISGVELEKAAQRLKDIGLSTDEARKQIQAFNAAGGDPKQAERIIRIGNDLNRVFGEGTMEKFRDAAAKGGDTLREFAVRLGIIPKEAATASAELQNLGAAATASNDAIVNAVVDRNRAIANEQRSAAQQIADLTRTKGTAEEEIALASSRRIEQINRDSNTAINDQIAARNKAAQVELAAFNKKIEDEAQAVATGGESIVTQIESKVKGLDARALGPTEEATRKLGVSWNDMLTVMSQSQRVQSTITDFTNLFKVMTDINSLLKDMATNRAAAGLPVATAPITPFAEGGLVTGPGSGTSDSIISRLSNGEFVMPALATRAYLPLLEAMRSMAGPIMPRMRMPRGFAAGGLVGAGAGGGGGSSVFLQFPGGASVGPMMADRQVKDALVREARRNGMKSAGRKPSTA